MEREKLKKQEKVVINDPGSKSESTNHAIQGKNRLVFKRREINEKVI